jgi:hypothetical protein
MIYTDLYEEGLLLVVAPTLNNDYLAAIRRYEDSLGLPRSCPDQAATGRWWPRLTTWCRCNRQQADGA